VKAVENGREAVAAIRPTGARSFDVVVMDVQMPEMSGFEATQAIRAREGPDARRLPIVALTAHAMQGDRARCLEAGMDGYLSKPIDVDELVATIERLAAARGRGACWLPAVTAAIFTSRRRWPTRGDRRSERIISLFRRPVVGSATIDACAARRRGASLAAHTEGSIDRGRGRPRGGRRARETGARTVRRRERAFGGCANNCLGRGVAAADPRRRGARACAGPAGAEEEGPMSRILVVDDDRTTRHACARS
jgi:CheY-like chemotaxis protein